MYPQSLNPLVPQQKKIKVEVADPEFDASVNEFIDAVIEEEQKEFQPGIESFQVHANRIREEVREAFYDFQQKYRRGYETICQWLEAHGIEPPVTAEKPLDEFIDKLSQGNAIHELLGFTPETMVNLYKAAYSYAQEKEFDKGRDAFYFLVTIAPDDFDFWLGLAICCTQLKDVEAALDASLRAIEVDPTQSAAYMNAIHLYWQANQIDKALALCKQGQNFASEHSQQPWVEELRTVLQDAETYMKMRPG